MKRLLLLIIFTLPLPLLGEEVPRPAIDAYRNMLAPWSFPLEQKPEGINGDYRKITVSPRPENQEALPYPLLRYRLNTFATEQETGNAYPLYLAALKEFNSQQQRADLSVFQSEDYRKLDINTKEGNEEWYRLRFQAFPLYSIAGLGSDSPKITAADEERVYSSLQNVYVLLERASKKTYFDWSDEYKYEGIFTTLEPIHEARVLMRYLADKANWEIRNGRYDDAIKTIRVGLAHADHILESKPSGFLVGMLVGTALRGTMYEQLFLLAAQPDAPNLYPALMQLTVNQRIWLNAIQSESQWVVPQYSDDEFWASLDNLSQEEAKTALDGIIAMFVAAMSIDSGLDLHRTLAYLGMYQPAKRRLLQKGLSEQEIEALTTHQVIAPFFFEKIKQTYDLLIVEASMPIGESFSAIPDFDEHVHRLTHAPESPADLLLAMITPATQAARAAFYRQQQTLDLLKIVHAIRYYAAVHGGKLPASLEEITGLAVPKICPITATPYRYSVEGRSVMIDYERHQRDTSRLEIVVE